MGPILGGMDNEPIEVSPAAPRPKPCHACGADRPPNATYCDDCKAARLTVQWRDQKRRYRARISAKARERQQAEAAERRRAFLDKHGM